MSGPYAAADVPEWRPKYSFWRAGRAHLSDSFPLLPYQPRMNGTLRLSAGPRIFGLPMGGI